MMVWKLLISVLFLFSYTSGLLASDKRSHNHGPDWSDHCWDQGSNHHLDPFCALLNALSCTAPPDVDHASHSTPETTKPGVKVTYTCDENYEIQGNDTIVCVVVDDQAGSKTAVWTNPPSCTQVTCTEASHIDNGRPLPYNATPVGEIVQYVYDDNYGFITNDNYVNCLNDTLFTCTEAPHIDNGRPLPYNATPVGEIVQYVCDDNYGFITSYNYVTCQNDTLWSLPPECEILCPDPPQIVHGGYSPHNGPLFAGTQISYHCDTRYGIVGNENIVCGKQGTWSTPPRCQCSVGELDILFILDASGSVGITDFERTLALVADYVDLYENAEIRFALISFSNVVRNGFDFNTYVNDTDALRQAINQTSYTAGGTDTGAALQYARVNSFTDVNGMRDSARQIAIVITDGESNNSFETKRQADLLKANNVTIYAIGIGVPDTTELEEIASNGRDDVFLGETYINISQIAVTVQQAICEGRCPAVPVIPNGQALNPISSKVGAIVKYKCDDGYEIGTVDYVECNETNEWSTPLPECRRVETCGEPPEISHGSHGIPVSYQLGGTVTYSCLENTAYKLYGNDTAVCDDVNGTLVWTNIPSCECERNYDVVFIIDGSGSVGTSGFVETLDFVNDMIDQYSADTTRFGLLVYSSNINPQFNLDDYVNDIDALKDAVANTSYPTGNTLTYDALTYARTEMFQVRNGMRTNASQIAIIVTDGKSADPNKTEEEAEKLKDVGVAIYSVGVGSSVDDVELTSMASSADLVFHVDDYANISTVTGPLSTSTCVVTCPAPPEINNGYIVNGNDTSLGAVVSYMCNDSYRFESYSDITCLITGLWSPPPKCVSLECEAPPTIDNGKAINENDTFIGAQVNYTCDVNYVFASNFDVICQSSGNWTEPSPVCRPKECGPIPTVLHSVLASQPNTTYVGTNIYYTCESNYRLVGKETVTCQDNEQWTATPTCECQNAPLDIVFIADTSGSVGLSGFLTTVDFITLMTEVYPKDTTRFGLISFSSNATVEFYLDTYINNNTGLREAIKNAEFSAGGTDTYEAFQLAGSELFNVTNGMRENVTHIAVVVTDGQSNNGNLTINEAQNLKDNGIVIYSVGVGDFDTVELKAMASDDAYVFNVKSFGDLSSVAGPLTDLMCFGNQGPSIL